MNDTPVDLDEAVGLIPFENFSRGEMIAHLKDYHSIYPYSSKETKAYMTEKHVKSPTLQRIAHHHLALTGDGASYRDLTAPLDKPLSAGERKALVDLVNNDFNALKQEILRFSQDMSQSHQAEIRREWEGKGKRKQEFLDKAVALRAKQSEAFGALKNRADAAGVTLSAGVPYGEPAVVVKGFQAALSDAEREVQDETRSALLTWERSRLTALRQVLMAGISAEGLTLLGTVPTAKELMGEAMNRQKALTATQSAHADQIEYDTYDD